jgi:5S rRNA maturation endonuclease (ribonuclease M5)
MVSTGSLINIAEMIFNLRDLNRSMEVIVLVDPQGKHTNRLLRQLLQHPIEGMQIMTRRQLQKALHGAAPPGREL